MASWQAFGRRWIVFLGIASISLIFLYRLHGYQSTRPNASTTIPYEPPRRVDDGRYHWADRPQRYPLTSLISLPTAGPKKLPIVQHKFGPEDAGEKVVRLERRQQVKDAFLRCWNSYRDRAWLQDELAPISGGSKTTFGGWAATLVDALDTLWIMDLKGQFHEAVEAARGIDFSKSADKDINVFETTIRYLGGFLAAYDLSGDKTLLDKAVELGEMLLVPFDTPNHMPITRWDWKKAMNTSNTQEAPKGVLVSEIGSLSLEFTRLSQLTGDSRWYDAIHRITQLFDAQQHETRLRGLWPVVVNARDQDLTGDYGFTLGGMSDSTYEYFSKMYALLGGLMPVYRKLYEDSMMTAIKHLFFRPYTPSTQDILISGDARTNDDGSSVTLEPKGQHLTCFVGGMLGLGGRLLNSEEHVKLGGQITNGCIWAYNATSVGVMPEIARFMPCEEKDCTWDRKKWEAYLLKEAHATLRAGNATKIITEKKLPEGFTSIDDHRYILRPEAIESVFVMYRITGEPRYREAAWQMFTAIQKISETQYGNAAIPDITNIGEDGLPFKSDSMESFWLAETLKYFYLIFSEPELISLNEYVLNTEAHPFRRPI